jgi:hypothetical protein
MKPGKIKIVVGEEIKVTAESDISALKEKALQQIKGMLTEGSR